MLENAWPIASLLSTVFGSIFEVFLLCVAGYVLARQGIPDKKTQKHINRINVSLFTPSLLFSKVAFSLTPEKLRELWIIPIVFVVTTLVSMGVAYSFGSILRLKRSQRAFAMAASMFMNSNSLPVALMQSMVYSVKMLRWGDDDTTDAMLGRALTYLVLYSTFGMVLRWSYGVHLLAKADEEEPPKDIEQAAASRTGEPTESSSLLHNASHPIYSSIRALSSPAVILHKAKDDSKSTKPKSKSKGSSSSSSSSSGSSSSSSSASSSPSVSPSASTEHLRPDTTLLHVPHMPHLPRSKSHIKARYFQSFPTTPMYPHSDTSSASSTDSDSDSEEGHTLSNILPSAMKPKKPWHVRTREVVWKKAKRTMHAINSFMTAPMWAALLSLLVACIPPLQHAMSEHAKPLKSALNSAGNCSIPLTLIVLGAYFWVPEKSEEAAKEERGVVRAIKKRLTGEEESRTDKLVERVKRVFRKEHSNHHHHHHHKSSHKHKSSNKITDLLPAYNEPPPKHHHHIPNPFASSSSSAPTPSHSATPSSSTAVSTQAHHHHHNPLASISSHLHLPTSTTKTHINAPHIVRPSKATRDPSDARPGETKTVLVAVLSRMVLTPLVLLPLLALLIFTGATSVFDDPVFALTNVLLITSAPALTLAQITQAASGDAFERLISRTIFWAYCVVTPVSTVVSVVIGLLLTKI